jgi:hypothetical protein
VPARGDEGQGRDEKVKEGSEQKVNEGTTWAGQAL